MDDVFKIKAHCYATHYLFNNETTSPSFLRADSQRGAAELTIAHKNEGE